MGEGAGKSVLRGIDAVRRDNPWPEFEWGCVEPFYLSLDAGGRELVLRELRRMENPIMFEIGCFLCGPALLWLNASENLTLIGVDPWDANWAPYVQEIAANKHMRRHLDNIADVDQLAADLKRYGNYVLALNNARAFKDRFIPLRRRSPEALEYLKKRAIEPDVIYIDAFKEKIDVEVALELFPNAIVCGDDWNWRSGDGELQMQEHVLEIAETRGLSVVADRATWILTADGPPPRDPHDFHNASAAGPARRGV